MASTSGPSRLRRFVIRAVGALLLLFVSFAAGVVVGRRPVAVLTQRIEQVETSAAETEAQTAALNARLHAHRALSLLYQTNVDVEARNFGIANERLNEVVAALDRVDRERFGGGAAELEAVRNALAEVDILVAEDLAGQRAVLSGLAQRLAVALGG